MITNQGAFYTGQYRNLLKEFGYEEEAIQRKINETWQHLFESDEDSRIYHPVGEDMGYLLDTGNLDVRTEGQSYGMMMAVQMNRKDIFDRIWKWTKTYMYMTSGVHAGYYAWSCNPDGTRRSNGPAPDGEEYFALALFFASHRWGDREPPFDYSVQARQLLHTCLHQGEDGRDYPMWNRENKLIKFVPEVEFSDPSYHLPHFYELFAMWADPADQEFWAEAAMTSREYLQIACHPVTGLVPEYAYYDGSPNHTRGYGHFFSDSYRVAANIGLDYEWFRKDPRECELANKIQAFFADKDPEDYRRYTIGGEPFEEKALHPVGLLATNAAASLAATGPYAKKFVELFWNTPPREGNRRYYDNCLYFFALLALSGNFRIWFPSDEQMSKKEGEYMP